MNSISSQSHPRRPSFHPPPPPSQPPPLPSDSSITTQAVSSSFVAPPEIISSSSSKAKSPGPLDPETELIQTEESYVNDLRILVETFVIPLEKWFQSLDFTKPNRQPDYCLETIACEQNINIIDALFANIKVILQCNQLLLDGLHSAEKLNKEGAVIESFAKHAPYLKLYSQYTRNCQRATELLTQLRTDIRFSSFITCAELQKQCRGLNLQSFLIMPIQRGPRYELLLKEIKKHAKNPELKEIIQKAIDIIVAVIKNIDSAVVGDEKREKLLEIQEAFRITLAEPARYVVKCGDLKKVCHTGKRVFYFVLCNDLIFYGEEMAGLFTKNSKQRYKFHREIFLSELRLVLISGEAKSFIMIGPDKAFEVEAASTEECSHWIESIIELKTATTLNIHRSESNQKPMKVIKVWQIDNSLGNTSIRLAKFSIPEGKDTGVMMMEDLIPLEDEMSLDNYRDSLSMSNIGGYSKAVVDRTSSGPNKMSFRNRGESSGLPLPNTTAVNARSKSVTSSSTSSEPITFDDLHLSISSTNTKLSEQKMDVFAGEILVPTVASVEPPRLHSVWSTDFEDSSHKSLPRSVSSPEIRNSAGLTDLITSSSGLSPHNSVNVESAFQVKPASVGPVTNSASTNCSKVSANPPSKNMPSSMHKAQQPSFLDDDDLFEFLTSNSATSQTHATQLTPAHNTPQTCPPRSQSKRLVLDNEKFILRR